MQRSLQPELLDTLPPNHPDALHNRRDLRLTNKLLGNHRWISRMLPRLMRQDEVALEVGAGTGELALGLGQNGVAVDGLDLWPRPVSWPSHRQWHSADLRTFDRYHDYPVVFGSLIFHQFSEDDLATLGTKLRSRVRIIIACEPARRRLSQFLYRVVGPMFGANHVSLHDAHVSIAAGFRGSELTRALGLDADTWHTRCTTTALGAYRMTVIRRA